MKKLFIIISIAITAMCALCVTAYAAVGDVAGTLYTTDILTRVDGKDIPSYCIDGQTLIAVEDLRNFGFTVQYDDSVRALFATYNNETYKPGMGEVARGTVGGTAGYYYETDIRVLVNGTYIPSYAIDGVMVVVVEELGKADYFMTYSYDDGNRLLSLYTEYDGKLNGSQAEQYIIDNYFAKVDESNESLRQFWSDHEDYEGDLVKYELPGCTFFYGHIPGLNSSISLNYLVYQSGVYFPIDQVINGVYNDPGSGYWPSDNPYWHYPENPDNMFSDFGATSDLTAVFYRYDGANYQLDVTNMINTPNYSGSFSGGGTPVTRGIKIGDGAKPVDTGEGSNPVGIGDGAKPVDTGDDSNPVGIGDGAKPVDSE